MHQQTVFSRILQKLGSIEEDVSELETQHNQHQHLINSQPKIPTNTEKVCKKAILKQL